MTRRRVVLLTDFGTADGYAAAMTGVIATATPDAVIEHASHDIEPGDIPGGALALRRFATLFPPDTVYLVVVDPGVGTGRRALAARVDDRFYVAPDNGVLSYVLSGANRAHIVAADGAGLGDGAAPTFHGRDIFAPAAAHLAGGGGIAELGPMVHDPVLLPLVEPTRTGDGADGEVLHVDRFGNLITNLPGAWLSGEPAPVIHVADHVAGPVRRTYGDVPSGRVLALVGSLGLLEISVRDGRASDQLDAGPGTPVRVRMSG